MSHIRRHHRRDPSFYLTLGVIWALSWALVIGAGYGLAALVAYLLR
jgi:hypothetical protein